MDSLSRDGETDRAVSALRAGKAVILPTDTVYGLCASAEEEGAVRRAYALKGREASQPSALVAADVEMLLQCIPELDAPLGPMLQALLPGPLTLVIPNPARRFPWLAGTTPEAIGVRVPALPAVAAAVLARTGAVMATSANRPGGPDPRHLAEIPGEIRAGVGAIVDGGDLPGTPSTVLDLTGPQPRVLREGAAPADEALERVASLVAE